MINRLTTKISGFTVMACFLAAFFQSAMAASIQIKPPDDDQTVNVGDTFTITIEGLGFVDGSNGGGLDITWDPTVISLVSTDNVDTSPFGGDQVFGDPGTLTAGFLQNMSVTSLQTGVAGPDFDIAVLTFTAIAAGDTNINLALGSFPFGLCCDVWTTEDSLDEVDLQPGDFSGAMITVVEGLLRDISGVVDISGDTVPDVAHLRSGGRPRVLYFSGADGQQIKGIGYLTDAWNGVAVATVTDSDANGVADDPAVAVLGANPNNGKRAVEVRSAADGGLLYKLFFMGPNWTVLDVAVIEDLNGDGVTGDTALAVLGVNPQQGFLKQIKVQVRRLSNGQVLANWFFFNSNWTALALEGVSRMGAKALLSVLAYNPASGASKVQALQFNTGAVQGNTTFLTANWRGQDVSLVLDSNGDGTADDPAYLVLANNVETGANKVQARRVSDGAFLKNIKILAPNWWARRVTGTGDISGNLGEEVGALAERRTDGKLAIQLKDFADRTTTLTFFP